MIINGQEKEVVLNKPRVVLQSNNKPGGITYYVSEVLPHIRTLKFTAEGTKQLMMPYVQYHYSYHDNYKPKGWCLNTITFSNEPIKDKNSIVYFPPLPHVHLAMICGVSSLSSSIESQITLFWLSSFYNNTGYEGVQFLRLQKAFRTYNEWETLTKTNPQAILKTDWYNKSTYMANVFK